MTNQRKRKLAIENILIMKKVLFTLLSLFVGVAMFAQSQVFDGSEFNNMTPKENAEAYTAYMKTSFKLTNVQAVKVYDIRLKSAEHVQTLDKAIESGRSRDGYQEKRNRIIEAGTNKILNIFTRQQVAIYTHKQNKAKAIAERKAARAAKKN